MQLEGDTKDIGYDPFDVTVMSNPLPYYERLRKEAPVYYTPQYDTFWLSRFDDIVELTMADPDSVISSESSIPMPEVLLKHHKGTPPFASTNPMSPMTMLHNPHYREIRAAHAKPFRPADVKALEGFVRDHCVRLLDEFVPKRKFDLFLDYAGMVSALVTCRLFDIDPAEAEDLLDTVNAITMYDPDRGGIDNALFFTKLKRFMLPPIARRREQGPDGSMPMFDGLLLYHTKPDGRLLTDDEIADELTCAFIANTETPGKVTARGLLELSRHPDQLAEVRAGLPNSANVATEEMLRFGVPNQWFLRTVHKDIVIAGTPIKAGQRVAGLIACGNRDESVFEKADQFIWNRPIKLHLAFGQGLHHCLGLHIARLQIRVAVEEFLKRVTHYRCRVDEAVLRPSYFHWAYSSLPVEILD